jgi:hypothetical protein
MAGNAILTTVASSEAIPEPRTVTATTQRPGAEDSSKAGAAMVLWSACSGPLTVTGWSSAATSAGPASLITITSPYAKVLSPPFSQVERL